MATLLERAIGVARLDAATYEEIEADQKQLAQRLRDHMARRAEQTARDIVAVREALDPGAG